MRLLAIALALAALFGCGGGGGGGGPATYQLTATAQAGGTVSPMSVGATAGSTQTFTITPSSGFAIAAATGCGGALNGASYSVTNVSGACSVAVTFKPIQFFTDVGGYWSTGLALQNNGADSVAVSADGRYGFTTGILEGAHYSVMVSQQPPSQVCVVANGAGVISATQPNLVTVDCMNRLVAATPILTVRTAVDSAGALQQTLYVRAPRTDIHQFRIRAADGVLEAVGPAWTIDPTNDIPVNFILSPDTTKAYADNGLESVFAATIRGSDGAIVPTWSAPFGVYRPALPVLLRPVTISPDGTQLFRSLIGIVGGFSYADLWGAVVSDTGLTVASGAPFMFMGAAEGPHVDPTSRFFARTVIASPNALEVYKTFTSTTTIPDRIGSYPSTFADSGPFGLVSETSPSPFLYEVQAHAVVGPNPGAATAVLVLRFKQDGAVEALGPEVAAEPATADLPGVTCAPPFAQARSPQFAFLPVMRGRELRYVVEGQFTVCSGTFVDRGVLALYVQEIVSDKASWTRVAIESLPGFADVDSAAWAHPTKPWIYFGSKNGQRVYGYSVDTETYAIQPLPGSPFDGKSVFAPTGAMTSVILGEPAGRFLYLTRSPDETPPRYIDAFAVDQTTGTLTPIDTYVLP